MFSEAYLVRYFVDVVAQLGGHIFCASISVPVLLDWIFCLFENDLAEQSGHLLRVQVCQEIVATERHLGDSCNNRYTLGCTFGCTEQSSQRVAYLRRFPLYLSPGVRHLLPDYMYAMLYFRGTTGRAMMLCSFSAIALSR